MGNVPSSMPLPDLRPLGPMDLVVIGSAWAALGRFDIAEPMLTSAWSKGAGAGAWISLLVATTVVLLAA